ncbi:MAG TPA: Gmad2 immunoglobulin-like domain-containing protein [Spirillospora sp.]|nr:Gmad2 immunoglobulin-like domain-containing protein [Spirillospora sp.]
MRKLIALLALILLAVPVGLAGAQENAAITITSPAPGAVLTNLNAITVTGTGTALFENSLTVQARDSSGAILAQQPVTTDAPEVGGTGNWQTTLAVTVTPGTPGDIRAFAVSANDGSVIAEAIINVTFGSSPPPSSITITSPAPGTILPNNGSFVVNGQATNIAEGRVKVQARDDAGGVLAEQEVIAAGADTGTGNWEATLAVNVAAGTTGNIRAFSEASGAEAVINVSFGTIPADVDITITFPANGATVTTATGITVTGTTRNIGDGRVIVQVRDGNNRVLAERQVQTSPTQGEGTWQALLSAYFTANTSGSIVAYTPGVGDGGQFLTDTVFVTFLANCAPRTDWPIYVVVRGDTLSSIARRVGSTTAELAQANCINNVNIIEVGQAIRVPRQPIVPTTPPTQQIITIVSPQNGAVLDVGVAPVVVTGTATGLGSVTVQALDSVNNVLAAQTVVVGANRWQANLSIAAAPGTTGRITAFATSPTTGSVVASASINVTYGQAQPTEPGLEITSPQDDAALNTAAPVSISGTGSGLFENTVNVRVLDNEGNVLAEQPALVNPQGNWSLSVNIPVTGTRGMIYAYSTSPDDGGVLLADAVNVIFGPAQPGPFVTIDDPLPYTILDPQAVMVSGRGGALFEGNVVVRLLDSAGNVLAEEPTTLDAAEVGGEGEWAVALSLDTVPGSRGMIEASSESPADGSIVALARIPVIFGLPDPNTPSVLIISPLPGTQVTAEGGVTVSGYAVSLSGSPITVQIIDSEGNILASRSASIDSETGVWQVPLTLVAVEAGTTGRLVAFASGPGGNVIASDGFPLAFTAAPVTGP